MPLSLIRDSGDMNRADSPSDSYPQPFFRFHPNCVQRDQTASCPIPITGSSSLQSPESGITSESTPVVKSCKHCSFSFRSDGKHAEVDFCSKDCRVCHTWFRSSSQSAPVKASSVQSSPISASERIVLQNQQTTSEKIKLHYTELKRNSDTSDCYKETWRVANPKGEKIILSSNTSPRSSLRNKKSDSSEKLSKLDKSDKCGNSSPSSATAVSGDFINVNRPLAHRPYLFY